jgi:DpnII restriction endonuclease/queuosine biosynthesis protein QueC
VSRTIEVCCNGASSEGHKKPLRLEYRPDSAHRNVRIGIPRFVRDLLHIPPRTLDLLELAAYIYAADRHTRRGSRDAVEFHSWSRRFRMRMRVRDLGFWSRAEVQDALRSCLTFMTGHADFAFVFTGGHKTPPTSLFDQEGVYAPFSSKPHEVALFSGGLDSLSGAVDTLTGSDVSLVLVGHHSQPGTKQVQRQLGNALDARFPRRATMYGFECTLSGVRAAEETQRSRSFLYTAIGFAIASAYRTSSLTIYENGVTSLNLRRREDLANARASRTTHPRTLAAVQKVLSLVADESFGIKTPAFWLTKRGVVERLVASGHGDLIASSVSCSRTFQREGSATHCGRCFQCVDRRLAIFAAGHEQFDDAALYTVDITRNAIPDEESRTTTVDYLRQAAHLADSPVDAFYAEYLSELADVLDALPAEGSDLDRVQQVWELMQTHGENVRHGLLRVRQLYDDPLAPLPPDSLLSLVAAREHLRPPVLRLSDAISRLAIEAVGEMFRVERPANENDLNAKLATLIGSHQELMSEHPSVPFACAHVTPDHTAVESGLLIEAKFIREGTPPSRASEGIAADLTKYPSRSHVLFLVYDPYRRIPDDAAFKRDFENKGRCTVTILR